MGRKQSEDTKKKISSALKGRVLTEEWKRKIGESSKGKENKWGKHKEETKKKHSEFMKEWHKNNQHPKGFLGKKRTKEYLENRSIIFSGEGNPNWQGGKNFEPYNKLFNNKFKRLIRKRDNQICMVCGAHREKLKRALTIHHINYDKLLSIPQNCISLCNGCHGKTNRNRESWIKFFQSLLSNKYNYNYSESKDIIMEIKT